MGTCRLIVTLQMEYKAIIMKLILNCVC